MLGKHDVLVNWVASSALSVLISRDHAMVVRNIDAARGISFILLILISLQATHHLVQIHSSNRFLLFSFTLNTHLHHTKQVFIVNTNASIPITLSFF